MNCIVLSAFLVNILITDQLICINNTIIMCNNWITLSNYTNKIVCKYKTILLFEMKCCGTEVFESWLPVGYHN
jgi:hypothetical protein